MTNRHKAHRNSRVIGATREAEKMAHRLKLEADDRNKGPVPSTLGWGIRKSTKKVSLFDPFKGGK
jgi:hypothetical protein